VNLYQQLFDPERAFRNAEEILIRLSFLEALDMVPTEKIVDLY
jgi:hypothetical protein